MRDLPQADHRAALSLPAGRILLSAYACEPGLGSEASVGWNWALGLAQAGCRVHVITRRANQSRIESWAGSALPGELSFTYLDLPEWARRWKRGKRGVHLYYLLWQWAAGKCARELAAGGGFSLVHHVTFVTARFPSWMGGLGLPFVFGPVAGGETAPAALWRGLGLRAAAAETARLASTAWWQWSPSLRSTLKSAARVFATSDQTLAALPATGTAKREVMLGIGLDAVEGRPIRAATAGGGPLRVIYAGNFLYWKGMAYGLRAVAIAISEGADIRLTMVGDGPCASTWKSLCRELGLQTRTEWLPHVERSALLRTFAQQDVLLFPSLHDSGGMVVLEAMAAALPVVCLHLGGPGVMVDDDSGIRVAASSPGQVAADLAAALVRLSSDGDLVNRLGTAARIRAEGQFGWPSRIQLMLRVYSEVLADRAA